MHPSRSRWRRADRAQASALQGTGARTTLCPLWRMPARQGSTLLQAARRARHAHALTGTFAPWRRQVVVAFSALLVSTASAEIVQPTARTARRQREGTVRRVQSMRPMSCRVRQGSTRPADVEFVKIVLLQQDSFVPSAPSTPVACPVRPDSSVAAAWRSRRAATARWKRGRSVPSAPSTRVALRVQLVSTVSAAARLHRVTAAWLIRAIIVRRHPSIEVVSRVQRASSVSVALQYLAAATVHLHRACIVPRDRRTRVVWRVQQVSTRWVARDCRRARTAPPGHIASAATRRCAARGCIRSLDGARAKAVAQVTTVLVSARSVLPRRCALVGSTRSQARLAAATARRGTGVRPSRSTRQRVPAFQDGSRTPARLIAAIAVMATTVPCRHHHYQQTAHVRTVSRAQVGRRLLCCAPQAISAQPSHLVLTQTSATSTVVCRLHGGSG